MHFLLESEGYDVVSAKDGIEALDVLAHIRPSVILLDVMMPRMNGYEFAEAFRTRDIGPEIPIVVLTANGRARQHAHQIGAAAGIAKPFDINDLLDTIKRLIQRSSTPTLPEDAERHP